MRYCWLSILFLLAGLATPSSPHWDDMHTKHSWDVTPVNWESLGSPPIGTTIDLHVALKLHRENALIDARSTRSAIPGVCRGFRRRHDGLHVCAQNRGERVTDRAENSLSFVSARMKCWYDAPRRSLALDTGLLTP